MRYVTRHLLDTLYYVLAHAYIRRSGFLNPKNMTGYTHKKEVIGSIFEVSVAKTFSKECPKLSKDPL